MTHLCGRLEKGTQALVSRVLWGSPCVVDSAASWSLNLEERREGGMVEKYLCSSTLADGVCIVYTPGMSCHASLSRGGTLCVLV